MYWWENFQVVNYFTKSMASMTNRHYLETVLIIPCTLHILTFNSHITLWIWSYYCLHFANGLDVFVFQFCVTNYHKRSGLKEPLFTISSQFCGSEVWVELTVFSEQSLTQWNQGVCWAGLLCGGFGGKSTPKLIWFGDRIQFLVAVDLRLLCPCWISALKGCSHSWAHDPLVLWVSDFLFCFQPGETHLMGSGPAIYTLILRSIDLAFITSAKSLPPNRLVFSWIPKIQDWDYHYCPNNN